MARWFGAASVLLGISLAPAPALADCQIGKFGELPVTMSGVRPIVTVQLDGHDAHFILDSGSFFSMMSRATALEHGLTVIDTGQQMRGVGGYTSMGETKVNKFGISGATVPNVLFKVGGTDMGFSGILGQNVLGLADVEYDLPHGMVRLTKGTDCRTSGMAYWAGTKPFSMVSIEPMDQGQTHTIGTVLINGVKIKAIFDSGAGGGALLTLAAAKRIGVTPDSPGVSAVGFAGGIGQNRVRLWKTQFDTIDIGGEIIKKPTIRIADQSLGNDDMLIGIDFFLTHRLYVDNQYHRLFFTYEGGAVFGLDPKGAFDAKGAALDLTDKTAEPIDAAGYSRRGALFATERKFDQAITDFDKAVAMEPGSAQYLVQRALAHLNNHQPLLGAADLDRAIDLVPTDPDARLNRAQLRISARDPAGALTDLKAADAALPPKDEARLRLAEEYDAADTPEPAIASFTLWLNNHIEDNKRAGAFNGRCWARALLNQELDKALSDCEAALRLHANDPAFLDSRGLVHLRRGEFDKAIADYDAVIAVQPRNAWSLYTRALAERRAGKTKEADTDRAAALAINPLVAERAKRLRIEE